MILRWVFRRSEGVNASFFRHPLALLFIDAVESTRKGHSIGTVGQLKLLHQFSHSHVLIGLDDPHRLALEECHDQLECSPGLVMSWRDNGRYCW